jgi:hypothetical protein
MRAAADPTALTHESVDPGGAARWWSDAALLLWRHPLRWALLGLVLMAALGGLGQLPWVGALLAAALTPALLGGWVPQLFAGLRAPHLRRPLLVLGALLAGSTLFILLAGQVLGLSALLGAVHVDGPEGALAQAQLGHGMLALLLLLTFSLFVSAALWFAPALVVLRGASAATALRVSLIAVRDNGLTFLLYAVVQLLLSALATLPEHVGWLLLVPWMLMTTYVSYRDVFEP